MDKYILVILRDWDLQHLLFHLLEKTIKNSELLRTKYLQLFSKQFIQVYSGINEYLYASQK